MTTDKSLSPRQHQVVLALLDGATWREAAAQVGITDRAVRKWRQQPLFVHALARARQSALDNVVTRGAGAAEKAMTTLIELLDPGIPAGVRARAAVAILEHTIRGTHEVDLIARLNELEDHIRGKQASASGNGNVSHGPGWLLGQVEAQRGQDAGTH
jgi:hypothetical protein